MSTLGPTTTNTNGIYLAPPRERSIWNARATVRSHVVVHANYCHSSRRTPGAFEGRRRDDKLESSESEDIVQT